jgi:hypothetical protein
MGGMGVRHHPCGSDGVRIVPTPWYPYVACSRRFPLSKLSRHGSDLARRYSLRIGIFSQHSQKKEPGNQIK